MSRCTYHPVLERLVRALTTVFIVLMGMATFNLVGCESTSGDLTDEDGVTGNGDGGSAQDTQFAEDYALAQNEEIAERYERWIALMDPFVTQNEDWTYTIDWSGFTDAISADYPDVAMHFNNKMDGLNPDIETVTVLADGIEIANEYMLQQYEALQDLPEGAHAATWSYGYWWGRKVCYNGSSWNSIEVVICVGSAALFIGPTAIGGAYLAYLCYWSTERCTNQFCINFTWAGVAWGSCS